MERLVKLLEREMFQKKVVEKIKTHVMFNNFGGRGGESCRLWSMWKNT